MNQYVNKPLPMPINEDGSVIIRELVKRDQIIPDDVMVDLEARLDYGENKYHQPLAYPNIRQFALDAYQEILDGINYMRGAIIECDEKFKYSAIPISDEEYLDYRMEVISKKTTIADLINDDGTKELGKVDETIFDLFNIYLDLIEMAIVLKSRYKFKNE